MVHLYPKDIEHLENNNAPLSEQKVYRLFKCLDDKWYIWHSLEWLKKKKDDFLLFGESDFLVFNPDLGYLILEVKGGSLSRNIKIPLTPSQGDFDGVWTRDYYNEKGKLVKNELLKINPFKQARKSMFYFKEFYIELVNTLKNNTKKNEEYYKRLLSGNDFPGNYHFGVIFPDCAFKNENTSPIREIVKEMIFDANDKSEQEKWMREIPSKRDRASPIEKYLTWLFSMHPKRTSPPELAEFFKKMINYQINTKICLNSWLDDQQYILEHINKVQDFILDMLEYKKRCLFNGSAGTGKTFIAMKKVIFELEKGHKALFLCYNRKLAEFVNVHLKTYNNALLKKMNEKYRISTIDRLIHSIARTNLNSEEYDYFREQSDKKQYQKVANIIKNILLVGNDNYYKFDAIIVDEGQDIRNEFWAIIHLLEIKEEPILYVFYDQTQAKFNKDFDPDETGLDLISDKLILRRNLRNADEIIQWVHDKTNHGEYNEFLGLSSIKHNFEPEHFSKLQDALGMAMKKIAILHQKSFISPVRFTILCDKKFEIMRHQGYKIKESNVKNINFLQQMYTMEYTSGNKIQYFLVETKNFNDINKLREVRLKDNLISYNGIGTFKGLENDIIMLVIQSPQRKEKQIYKTYLQDLYIGASRAKFLLYIYTYSQD